MPASQPNPITTHNAEIRTATVEIKTLTVSERRQRLYATAYQAKRTVT